MFFWVLSIAMTLAVLYALIRPLRQGDGKGTPVDAAAYDVSVFKSQLREIESDLARGRLTEEEVEASRIEIGRRLLAADKRLSETEAVSGRSTSPMGRKIGIVFLGLGILTAIILYADLGDPANPDMPLALRGAELAIAQQATDQRQAQTQQSETAELDQIADQIQARIQADEATASDWGRLGGVEMMRGNYSDAATAFRTALETQPANVDFLNGYGEALVFWAEGLVTDEAARTFDRALRLSPGDPRASFYLAQYHWEQGNRKEAMDRLIALLRSAPAGAEWQRIVRDRAEALAAEMNIDLDERLAEPVVDGEMRGPSADDIEAAQEMSSADQQEMIAGMVGNLAARLEENPEDLQGWLMLGRSYNVLGRLDEAASALERASQLAPENVDILIERGRLLRSIAGNVQTPESVALMRVVVEKDPGNVEALWFLGLDAFRSGDREKAREYFDRAIAEMPENSAERLSLQREIQGLFAATTDN